MKKIIEMIKKKDLDVLAIIASIIVILAFYRTLMSGDELWLFAYVYKMNIGYKIYNDLNVIITPLFFWIGNILFTIFQPNFLTFTIYNIIISTSVFMLVYKLFRALEVERRRAIFYTILLISILENCVSVGAEYNKLALIPILVAIILLIKGYKRSYLFGILGFITFMCKQNIGIYFMIGIIVYKLLEKITLSQKIKEVIKFILTIFVLSILFIFILFKQGILYNFINYAFLGISEFRN